ncbi:MAG: Uncharacterised protein [Hyphomonas sp. TMED17]|nr:MAG: Uncharacterised protein [Hyphomonas sp. TMED17]
MLFSGSFYRSIVAKFFMLISISKRFLFIANSKTASTSLSKALRPYAEIERQGSPDRKHVSMGAVLDHYKFLFELPPFAPDTFFRFGVIRDPLDWIHSWYRYRQRAKGTRLKASSTQDIDENLKAEIVEFYARDYELISQTEDLNKAGLAHLKNTRS